MLEEVVVSWWEVRNMVMRQNLIAWFIHLLKHWFCDMRSGVVMEKNLALSVDQCRLQALQFLVHVIDLLSILLRCNGFTEIQKVVVDQVGSSPSNSDHDLFLSKFGFGKCFGASFLSSHWAGLCWLSYKIHFLPHITIR